MTNASHHGASHSDEADGHNSKSAENDPKISDGCAPLGAAEFQLGHPANEMLPSERSRVFPVG